MTYKVSEATKQRLIDAAGELFSRQGTENVTVKQITQLAGTKENAISYHFGGKAGLIKEINDIVLARWRSFSFLAYLRENENLFDTKEGQRKLITDLISKFYALIWSDNESEADWIKSYILKGYFNEQGLKYVETNLFEDSINNVLFIIYQRITGSSDKVKAHCWLSAIILPAMLIVPYRDFISKHIYATNVDKNFYLSLKEEITRNALYGIGLTE